jgi:hypothetical protein
MRLSRVALAVMLVLGSCTQYFGAMDLHDLQADPASQLRMPDAAQLAHFAKDRSLTPDGPSNAFEAYLFGTKAPTEQVIAFYERELAKMGWTRYNRGVNTSTTELRADGWCKPRVTFRVAIKDPRANAPRLDSTGQPYPTVFDAGLMAVDPDEKCPGR